MLLFLWLLKHGSMQPTLQDHWPIVLGIAAFQALGMAHGTTLPLLLGFLLGLAGIGLWVPLYSAAAAANFFVMRWQLRSNGDFITWLSNKPKWQYIVTQTDEALAKRGQWAVFWLRLSPLVPFGMGSLLLARAGVPWWWSSVYGVLGAIPRTLVVMQVGKMAASVMDILQGQQQPGWSLVAGLALLATSIVGMWWWGRRALKTR